MEVFTVNSEFLKSLYKAAGATNRDIADAKRFARDPEKYEADARRDAAIEAALEKYNTTIIQLGYVNAMKKVFATFESELYTRLAYYTPVDTGNLLGSIYAKQIGKYAVQIGFSTRQAPYAYYVHELDNKHPNGGQKQFLLDAVTDAWQATFISSYYEDNEQAQDAMQIVLAGLHYFIDTDKHKLAVTINGKFDNMYSIFDNLAVDEAAENRLATNLNEAKQRAFTGQKSDYSEYFKNFERIASKLSPGGLMALQAYFAAVRQDALYDANDRLSKKSHQAEFDRLEGFTKHMTGMTNEEFMNVAMENMVGTSDGRVLDRLMNMAPGINPARLAFERNMQNARIIYPAFIDEAERAAKRKAAEAEREAKRLTREQLKADRAIQRQYGRTAVVIDMDYDEFMANRLKSDDSMLETDIEKATDV